jgi:acetate kinase
LTVNSGSSSIKLGAFEREPGGLRGLGELNARMDDRAPAAILREFLRERAGRAASLAAHRVVHGGQRLTRSCRIGPEEEAEIERLSALAPLHNPPALQWIRACRDVLGAEVPQVAVFDTAFFAHLPPVAATYALPAALSREQGLRRYGFHGTAHRALWQRWRALRPELPQGGRAITLQLGAGCSASAIAQGRALDTSMGFSPMEGLVMATRSGDLDPGLVIHLQRALGWSAERLERTLNRESGLLGLSGRTGDMRALLESDDAEARLAVELFCYRVRKYIGAYLAVLGGADGLLFGGGIGEHAPAVRERILGPMGWCGLRLDPAANRAALGREARISAPESAIACWVIPVDEARVLAGEALEVMGERMPEA